MSNSSRRGVTLLELMVVIASALVILGLSLTAIQRVREASRRMQCMNHMRQIQLAVAAYENANRRYPYGQSGAGSFLVAILPFMEQVDLAKSVTKFVLTSRTVSDFGFQYPIYYCPSDGAPKRLDETGPAGSNYCGNSGDWVLPSLTLNGIFQSESNFGFGSGIISSRDVFDGLSNTDCISEHLRADSTKDRMRTVWNLPSSFQELRQLMLNCTSIPSNPGPLNWPGNSSTKGTPWVNGSIMVTLYNHVCTPNQPSCFNGSSAPSGAATVSSSHPGIVNMVFADGHAHAIDNEVDQRVWLSWGSRNDGASSSSLQ